jgi:hypothetical protein
MNIKSVLVPILALLLPARLSLGDPAITQEELLRRSQELFDSLITGNKEPWQKYYADDAIYFDEKGRNSGSGEALKR